MTLNGHLATNLLTCTAIAAVTTHAWLHYHSDPVSLPTVVVALTLIPGGIVLLSTGLSEPFSHNLLQTYVVFIFSLTLSVCAYRLSPLHPLANYPGPIVLKLTKLRSAWITYRGDYHIYLKSLHDKYGQTVRVGPNELSTIEKELIPQILGNQGMPKGPIWDGRRFAQAGDSKGYDSLIDARDPLIHPELRKSWNKSFTSDSMRNYEDLLIPRVIELNSRLRELCSSGEHQTCRVDIAQWVTFFSYDFMGDFALTGNFHVMRDGDVDGNVQMMTSAMHHIATTQQAIWSTQIARNTPVINTALVKFIAYCINQGVNRSIMDIQQKDLFYYMGEAAGKYTSDLPLIITNVILAIVAGSDTSASVLSNAIYLLISNPEDLQRLQKEVDEAFETQDISNLDTLDQGVDKADRRGGKQYGEVLGGLEFLNAVINETLRLFPAVPTSLQRAPAKGTSRLLQHAHTSIFLPGGNAVTVPPYVLHRNPLYFSPHPNRFIPERWMSSAVGYTTSRDAFIPFSVGPQNCAGRTLALMELRYGIATLVRNFDMSFDTPAYNPAQWEMDLKDWFTFSKGALKVQLQWRGGRGGRRGPGDVI